MKDEAFNLRSLLVVEDDPNVAVALRRRLSKLDIDVQIVGNGHVAIRCMEEASFDAVLSDIHMPEMNGMELLFEMRKRGWDIPVVFLTGYASDTYLKESIRLGAIDFIEKPWGDEELCEVVTRVVEIGRRIKCSKELPADQKERNDRIANLLRLKGVRNR